MLVSKVPISVDHPHEPGVSFDFLRVPWGVLRAARRKASREQLEVAAVLGASILEALQSKEGADNAQELIESNKYNEAQFDTKTLLESGLDGWSGPGYDGVECNAENRARLDEGDATWAKQQIIDLTKPADEEEEKNS